MITKTTNKKTQYVLGSILILTAVLATSAFNPDPVNFDHQTGDDGAPALHSLTTQDFHIKEANDLAAAANWNAVEAFHIKEAADLRAFQTAAAAPKWDAAKAFHTKEANDLLPDAPFPNNGNRH